MGKPRIEQGSHQAERGIDVEHGLQRADPVHAVRDQPVRSAGGERSGRDGQRADQAVAREYMRPVLVRRALRERRLFERDVYPDVAGGRIYRADESNRGDENEVLDLGDRDPGEDHQHRASQKQRAHVVARRQVPDRQGRRGRAEKRGRCNDADLERIEAQLQQIGRQDDGGEPVAESARGAGRVQVEDVRSSAGAQACEHARATTQVRQRRHRSIGRRHGEVVEIHVAVGLRPQADASGDRLGQDVLQVELAVEIAGDLGPLDRDLEVVPLARRRRGVADPFDRGTLALLEFPQHEIVLERIGADRQVVAVGLEIEQDSGALIDAADDALEPHRDFAVAEIRDVLGDDVGEIGERLDAVEELGVAVAVECARLVGDAGRRLSLLPLAAVDGEHLVVALRLDPPDPDDAQERFGFGPHGVVGEVDLQKLPCIGAQKYCGEAEARYGHRDRAFDHGHG